MGAWRSAARRMAAAAAAALVPAAAPAALVPAAAAAALVLAAAPAAAQERGRAGDFDYYVLSLSWSPSWCAREGDARGDPQCRDGAGRGFVLHGLWPQYERGWPEYCGRAGRDPSRRESAAMADLTGSAGLAWHQWKKHGRCTGLSGPDYYRLSRLAWERVVRPEIFRRLRRAVSIDAAVVEAAFLEANPGMEPDGVTVTCREGRVAEVRICLTRDLSPRRCGADAVRDCRGAARMPPVR